MRLSDDDDDDDNDDGDDDDDHFQCGRVSPGVPPKPIHPKPALPPHAHTSIIHTYSHTHLLTLRCRVQAVGARNIDRT